MAHHGERLLRAVNHILALGGVRLARAATLQRRTMEGALQQLRRCGARPETVIDVGAAHGEWSEKCHRAFPDARFILIEPLEEYRSALSRRLEGLRGVHVPAVAGAKIGSAVLHVHRDLVGSSVLLEREGGDVNGAPRAVAATTVDAVIAGEGAVSPYLLKVDVQGAELAVLAGAERALGSAIAVILEVSFFDFFEEGSQFEDVIQYMRDHAFSVYDIVEPLYRPLDGALSQADFVFVPARSALRTEHRYATPAQRRLHDAGKNAYGRTV